MTSTLYVLDRTGDTRVEWDPDNPEEVTWARQTFDAAKRKRYLAYRLDANGRQGELLREFDPSAERIVMSPQTTGG